MGIFPAGRYSLPDTFTRVNNRRKRFYSWHLEEAGYPKVILESGLKWREIHDICKSQFIDGQGRYTYTWFGNFFFFTNDEDAHLFRSLILMV